LLIKQMMDMVAYAVAILSIAIPTLRALRYSWVVWSAIRVALGHDAAVAYEALPRITDDLQLSLEVQEPYLEMLYEPVSGTWTHVPDYPPVIIVP
jgi:hypothetical protein